MNGTNKDGLYGALEAALKSANEPLHCSELFDRPDIRKHAETVNRVSDYLGNMWRKGDVARVRLLPCQAPARVGSTHGRARDR